MQKRIQERLNEIESDYGFEIIYACESGSRAWGFESADSDYDVRFIYKWTADDYLGIYSPKDQVDLGVDAENLDFSGWDLRKSLPLFRKSNGALYEWLHSPIVYYENTEIMQRWRELAKKYFVPGHTLNHYIGLGRKIWLSTSESKRFTPKKYLYIIRALTSARYIIENLSPPPVKFTDIVEAIDLDTELTSCIEEIIAAKAHRNEADTMERSATLDHFIEETISAVSDSSVDLPGKQGSIETLNDFFQSAIGLHTTRNA